ncbi:MAG: ABC transporter permease [Clostridia bacterium]|nr:ABC transporter permease [Clostridia bacterium]
MSKNRRVLAGGGLSSFASSLIAIIVGLGFGLIILLISNPDQAFAGLAVIASGGFTGGMKGIGNVLYYATPLIMTGLSVGFAFKTGLFNIGASGQLLVGAFVGVFVGHNATWVPQPMLWVVALLAAILAGALWGAIPGLFKALLNVHEVIACIMCNYIALYGINFLIKNSNIYDSRMNQTVNIGQAAIPRWGMDDIFHNIRGNFVDASSVNGGIIIALVLAIVMYFVLNRTTFGYELKACGYNRNASRYAGINEKRSILFSMMIAGALAGTAGGLMYLAPTNGLNIRVEEILSPQGFNGISVALLGLSNPIGIIFTGLFVAYIEQGGYYLQRLNYMPEIIDIIIAAIIYFSAFALLVKNLIAAAGRRRGAQRERADGAYDTDGAAVAAASDGTGAAGEGEGL